MNVLQEQRQKAKSIQEHIARGKGYLRRGDIVKSIDAALLAFEQRRDATLIGKDKVETNYSLDEYCIEFSAHYDVLQFLESIKITVRPVLAYASGKEQQIMERLQLLRKGLVKVEQAKEESKMQQREGRKQKLFGRGRDFFESSNYPKGRSYLRQLVEEFDDDPQLLCDVARLYLKADFALEAWEVLEGAMQGFPDKSEIYSLATKALCVEKQYEKAEEVYLAALKQFGKHPMTLVNMSKMYLEWRKKDKAFERAKQALEQDPSLEEAREIVEKTA